MCLLNVKTATNVVELSIGTNNVLRNYPADDDSTIAKSAHNVPTVGRPGTRSAVALFVIYK